MTVPARNIAFQFLSISPTVERLAHAGDLATIMPTGIFVLAELVPRSARDEVLRRAVALTVGGVAALVLDVPNLAWQAASFLALLEACPFASPLLSDDATVAIRRALAVFVSGIVCFLSTHIGQAKGIPLLCDLTDAFRAKHAGTRLGQLCDCFIMYTTSGTCTAWPFSFASRRCA